MKPASPHDARLTAIARALTALVIATGALVLAAWLFGLDSLKSLHAGLALMQPSTALCFVLCGWAARGLPGLRAARAASATAWPRRLRVLCAAVGALAVTNLAFHLQHSVPALGLLASLARPFGIMSAATAFCFLLSAGSITLLPSTRHAAGHLAQILSSAVLAIAYVALCGYLLEVRALYAFAPFATMALHTALGFGLLAAALLYAGRHSGGPPVFTVDSPSAQLARWLLLGIALCAPLLGYLRLAGQRAGLYRAEFGIALMLLAFVAVTVALLWWATRRANVAEREIQRLQRLYAMLSQTNQMIVREHSLESLLAKSCSVAVEFGDFDYAWVAWRDPERGETRLVADAGDRWAAGPPFAAWTGQGAAPAWPDTTALAGDRMLTAPPHASAAALPWWPAASAAGLAVAALPLRRNGTVVGALNLYAETADFFADYARPTLEEVALDISFALDNLEREALRQRVEQALVSAEARYRDLVEQIPVGVYRLTAERRRMLHYEFVSPVFRRLLGLPEGDSEISAHTVLQRIHPADRYGFRRACAAARRRHRALRWEGRSLRGEQTCWLRIESLPRPGADGAQVWHGVVSDITERVQIENERARLHTQLQQAQKVEALGLLAGGIAHDFNNILSVMLGFLQLALRHPGVGTDAALRSQLGEVEQAGQRAVSLVRKLLLFGRTQNEASGTAHTEIATTIAETRDLLELSLPSSCKLITHSAADLPPVAVSSVDLGQVLMNLLANARDAGDGIGTITLSARRVRLDTTRCLACHQPFAGQFVELSVTDQGSGIERDVLDQLFQPFFTTKGVDKGTGLGLSIVHGIVHDAGGHIVVTSNPGRGTTFCLLLPPAKIDATAHEDAASIPEETPQGVAGSRILVVDDDASIRALLREVLEASAFVVDTCEDGAAALARFEEAGPGYAAVVSDQTMPGLTGDLLARELLARQPGLPVFLCTGFSDRVDEATAQAIGVHALLTKPLDLDGLVRALGAAVARARDDGAAQH